MAAPADLRRRVMGWRAAERREQRIRAREGPLDPDASLEAAIELHEFLPPETDALDVVRRREIASARAAWQTLRARLRKPAAGPRKR